MHTSSSLGIAAVDGCACFRYEILDDHECVLQGTQALLSRRIVSRPHGQRDRLLLAVQAVLSGADIVRKRDTLNG